MRKSRILGVVAALVVTGAGAFHGSFAYAQTDPDPTVGPLVTGKLKGETTVASIPFSAYADGVNPVIATEQYVNRGVVQTGNGSTFAPTMIREWDHLRYGGGAGTQIQLPLISTVLASNPANFPVHAILEITSGPTTLVLNGADKCFLRSGTCPTSLGAGAVYVLEADPTVSTPAWRLIPLFVPGSTTSKMVGGCNVNCTLTTVAPGDSVMSTPSAGSITMTVPPNTQLGFGDNQNFRVQSYAPTGNTITMTFSENVFLPAASATGFTSSKTVTIQPGEAYVFRWSSNANQWYGEIVH
jgi:hypothetical protein